MRFNIQNWHISLTICMLAQLREGRRETVDRKWKMFLELFQHTSQCRIGAFAKRVHATFPAHICLQPCIVGRYVEATTWTDFMAAFLFYAAKSCTWTRIQKPQITNHGEDDTEAASSKWAVQLSNCLSNRTLTVNSWRANWILKKTKGLFALLLHRRFIEANLNLAAIHSSFHLKIPIEMSRNAMHRSKPHLRYVLLMTAQTMLINVAIDCS